jgi:hypothetical protein
VTTSVNDYGKMPEVVRYFTPCLTASQLFEEFAVATHEHLKATGNLSTLVGQQEAFAEATKIADEKRLKSRADLDGFD